MESPALPDPPYNGRGSISSEGPATSSHSPSRRPSTQQQQQQPSPSRPNYGAGSTAAYFASSSQPQQGYSSISSHSLVSQAEDGQEYLGNNNNQYNQQPNSRQTSYDEQNPPQPHPDSQLQSQPYPAHLSQTQSTTSLSTTASLTQSHPTADSPRSLQPGGGVASPIPSSSSAGQDREDEGRAGEGLGLGRIAEPAPPPQDQSRRGSAWVPDRHDDDGHVPANFDESVLRALCDSDVSTAG